jgi:hypothetical protein
MEPPPVLGVIVTLPGPMFIVSTNQPLENTAGGNATAKGELFANVTNLPLSLVTNVYGVDVIALTTSLPSIVPVVVMQPPAPDTATPFEAQTLVTGPCAFATLPTNKNRLKSDRRISGFPIWISFLLHFQ